MENRNLRISDMLEMQRSLNERNKERWQPLEPESGCNQLLWMIGEIGEVIDIMKKTGSGSITDNPEVRARFIEEMADVAMYFNDVLACFGITAEEFSQAYAAKHQTNMNRDYEGANRRKYNL